MKSAILITGLVKQTVYRMDYARYYTMNSLPLIATDGQALVAPQEIAVQERIVPITQFCRPGRPDMYIAYSEEVEELLGIPFRTLLREKDEAYAELNRLRGLTPWEHIKCAWKAFWNLA